MKQSASIPYFVGEKVQVVLDSCTTIAQVQSPHQRILTASSPIMGAFYTLDGAVMASDREEFVVHESLVHMAALSHPGPRRVLILGGGDGGSVRECLKHPSVVEVVVAELDEQVVAVVGRDIPALPCGAFSDPRVQVRIGDAAATLDEANLAGERFDLILFDLTEPDDPACAHLHQDDFLHLCAASIAPRGIIQIQLGSPAFQAAKVQPLFRRVRSLFPTTRPALLHAPLYGGPWLLTACGLTVEPDEASLAQRLVEREITGLRYYNPAVHVASLALPNYIRELLT